MDYLLETGRIETERVEEAFRSVDRKEFIPEKYREEAYRDKPLPIAREATISAPHMVAENTELLEVEENSKVLEIGSGSGYQLAIISELAEKATGVEINPELVEKSRKNLENWKNTEVVEGNGLEAVDGSFDRVLFSCAVDDLQEAVERLKEGGIAVAPVKKNRSQVLTRYRNGEFSTHGRVRFVEKKS